MEALIFLAGRARSFSLFPLTSREISDFDLLKYCRYGGLPMIYLSDDPWLDLREYISLYIKEEITAEAIVRRVDHFARFLDVMGIMSGEEVNYQKIADDAAVLLAALTRLIALLVQTVPSKSKLLIAFKKKCFRVFWR